MTLTNDYIIKFLKSRNVNYLYHANTVKTSLQFIARKGLLSREAMETRGLHQTYQYTDKYDKKFGIFNDIFFDLCDIHKQSKQINYYGPVLFVFDLEILSTVNNHKIKITQKNPAYWHDKNSNTDLHYNKRYFLDPDTLQLDFSKKNFGQHITIENFSKPLPFNPHLKRIILDNPQIGDLSYFENAKRALEKAIKEKKLSVKLKVRNNCNWDCKCSRIYNGDVKTNCKIDIKKLFNV